MVARSLEHPILGRLTYNDDVDWWEAHVEFQPGHPVDLSLLTHTYGNPQIEIEELLRRGADYLRWSRCVEAGFRQRIADELLDCYNDNWASDDEEGQGPMSRDEFLKIIALRSIVLNRSTQRGKCIKRPWGSHIPHP